MRCHMGGSEGQGPRRTRPGRQSLALGTWNVTSLWGKEPELVREMERYQLDLVGLTSTHSLCSGTALLDRGWTLFFYGVGQGVRRQACVGILISEHRYIGVYSSEREGRLAMPSGCGRGGLMHMHQKAVQSTRSSWRP